MSVTEVLRTEKSWIQKSFEVCGGDACIRDTRIPVWALVAARQRGVDQEEMLHYFVTPLTPEDIETAWVYYEQHEQEIQRTMQEHEEA
jgi:uncharacterized protein (DUF433 family)